MTYLDVSFVDGRRIRGGPYSNVTDAQRSFNSAWHPPGTLGTIGDLLGRPVLSGEALTARTVAWWPAL
jgi:hypothetical protein